MTKKEAENILNILHSIPTKAGWFPKIEDIAKRLKLPKYKASRMLKELNELGMLSRTGNWYSFIEPEVSEEQAKDYISAITEENKHDSIEAESFPQKWKEGLDKFTKSIKNDKSTNFFDAYDKEKDLGDLTVIPIKQKLEPFAILRWLMGIIGVGAGVMSAYYTQIWQHETLNIFWSWFLSLIMIGFASAAFLTLIGLLTKSIYSKFSTWLLSGIFFILWIICLIYSIQVTVAGRYAQYQEIIAKDKVQENISNINKVKIDNILDSINSLKKDRTNSLQRLNTLLEQQGYIQIGMDSKGETWEGINKKINNIQKDIDNINKNIENKNIEYEKILGSGDIISQNELKFGFYDWAAKVYKTDRRNIEWIFMLFPSLFLDVASPIALAVFMFLGRKKEE